MVATTNIPGSSYFSYFVGTRADCETWLAYQKVHDEYGNGRPYRIAPNSEWKGVRYRDGSPVIKELSPPYALYPEHTNIAEALREPETDDA